MVAVYVVIYFGIGLLVNEILGNNGIHNFTVLILAIPFWPIALLIMAGVFMRELYFYIINKDFE